MKRERSPGSASAAVAPAWVVGVCWPYRPVLIRFQEAGWLGFQEAGWLGRGLHLPSREGAGACLPR